MKNTEAIYVRHKTFNTKHKLQSNEIYERWHLKQL